MGLGIQTRKCNLKEIRLTLLGRQPYRMLTSTTRVEESPAEHVIQLMIKFRRCHGITVWTPTPHQ